MEKSQGLLFSDVVLKDKTNIQKQMDDFVYSIGGQSKGYVCG